MDIEALKSTVASFNSIKLAILYGSMAKNHHNPNSDIDLAVSCEEALATNVKTEIIEKLALSFGRPVDLVDLQKIHGTLLKQILTKGSVIYCTDNTLYAGIMKRMLFNDADFMPYHHRILKTRREQWINS